MNVFEDLFSGEKYAEAISEVASLRKVRICTSKKFVELR
jgi:hypothetical protein